jgi:hypothetical protein
MKDIAMKNQKAVLLAVILLAGVFWSCSDEQGPTQGEGQISGRVTDASTGIGLASVSIVAQTIGGEQKTTSSDAEGNYSFTFTTDSGTTVTLTPTKSGYRDTIISVRVDPGVLVPLGIQLNPRSPIVGGTGGGGTGKAQTIAFLGSSPREVTVYGVGGQETAILGFEVRDSLGLPIDAAHAVSLTFTVVGGPGGGEYISPLIVSTNQTGRAYTTFNAGIRAGVVQVVAATVVDGRTISTSPIRLIIHAGFPDQAHFTIAADRFNFPTLGIAGERDPMLVIVGDVYSNPVATNTAVYFHSRAGVIQATVFTNADGQGRADLISGNPAPFGPLYAAPDSGDAYHYVIARTIGAFGETVQDSLMVLWSGHSQISNIQPATFSIPNGGSQNFTFTVSDFLGHPLAAGTAIRVEALVPPPPDPNAPVNQVLLSFGANGTVTLDDFIGRGPGRTEFAFRLSDGSVTNQATPVAVNITITGPNGSAYTTINGTVF